jgi:hypothetical protein
MKKASYLLATLVLCCGAARQVAADVVLFNNYGPGYTYTTRTSWTIGGPNSAVGPFETAGEFTPATTGAVTSVAFGASLVEGTNSVTMAIATDNGGTPGTILESFTFVNQMGNVGSQNSPLTATSVVHPLLTAGTDYFLLGLTSGSDTWAGWNLNNQGVTGTQVYSQDNGTTWTTVDNATLGAFEIFGTGTVAVPSSALAVAAPEPSSALAVGFAALAGLGVWARGRRAARVM